MKTLAEIERESNFKPFVEILECRIIPITKERKIYLDKKIVTDDEYSVHTYSGMHYSGEFYYDFLQITSHNVADLSGQILQEMYRRGFCTNGFIMESTTNVQLNYSFITDDSWMARKGVDVFVLGDIIDESDHRRIQSKEGDWMGHKQLIEILGKNRANKLFQKMAEIFED